MFLPTAERRRAERLGALNYIAAPCLMPDCAVDNDVAIQSELVTHKCGHGTFGCESPPGQVCYLCHADLTENKSPLLGKSPCN